MFELTAPISARSDLDWCWYLRRQGTVGEALERALHDVGVLQPGGWAPWAPSQLTNTGAPVEMQFTADAAGLSLITEVDDPARDPATRTARTYSLIKALGGSLPPAALRDVISAAQGAAPLSFGARLGLRQSTSHLSTTLYAEIPGAASDLMALLSPNATLPPVLDAADLKMLAHDGAAGSVTLYFEAVAALDETVPALAALAQVAPGHLLTQTDRILHAGKPGAALDHWHFSLTFSSGTQPPVLHLLYPLKPMYEGDDAIAKLVRDYPGAHVPAYAALMEQHAPAPNGQTHHGLIGLRARADTYPLLSIAVAAPWHCPYDAD